MNRYKQIKMNTIMNERTAYLNVSHNMMYLDNKIEKFIKDVMREFSVGRDTAIEGIADYFGTEIYK